MTWPWCTAPIHHRRPGWRTSNLNPIDIGHAAFWALPMWSAAPPGLRRSQSMTSTLTLEATLNARENLDLSVERRWMGRRRWKWFTRIPETFFSLVRATPDEQVFEYPETALTGRSRE